MGPIEWQDAFNLGIESVDREHRELLRLVNELLVAIQDEGSIDRVLRTLGEISVQLAAHFAVEESVMRDSRYKAYAEHKEDHEILLDELSDLMDEIKVDHEYDETRLTQDLMRWFSEHFRVHDAKLHGAGDA